MSITAALRYSIPVAGTTSSIGSPPDHYSLLGDARARLTGTLVRLV